MSMMMPQMGPAPAGPEPESDGEGPELLRQAIEIVRAYIESEKDDEDKLAGEKVTTLLQTILAKQQKEQDGMLQGKMSPRGIRQALGG